MRDPFATIDPRALANVTGGIGSGGVGSGTIGKQHQYYDYSHAGTADAAVANMNMGRVLTGLLGSSGPTYGGPSGTDGTANVRRPGRIHPG